MSSFSTAGASLKDAYGIKKFDSSTEFRVPHVGWNELSFAKTNKLFNNIVHDKNFYFVHSYFVTTNKENVIATSNYGVDFVSAVKKDPKTYEHIDPKLIGNHRNIIISNQAGRSNIISRLENYGIKINSKDEKIQKILKDFVF